jgi:hypothetical protein
MFPQVCHFSIVQVESLNCKKIKLLADWVFINIHALQSCNFYKYMGVWPRCGVLQRARAAKFINTKTRPPTRRCAAVYNPSINIENWDWEANRNMNVQF